MTKCRVLVLEDDRVLADVIRFNLQRAGFDVVVLHDGRAAAEAVRNELFDVVVSDYQLPGMDGKSFVKQLRDGSRSADAAVLLCSAKRYELDVEALKRELGIREVFTKPFSPRELVAAVQQAAASRESTITTTKGQSAGITPTERTPWPTGTPAL